MEQLHTDDLMIFVGRGRDLTGVDEVLVMTRDAVKVDARAHHREAAGDDARTFHLSVEPDFDGAASLLISQISSVLLLELQFFSLLFR
jgi:hypothetical protein